MYVEVIADGKHLPASLLKLIYKLKGADKICLVTDAVGPAGIENPEGQFHSNAIGVQIIVEDGVAKLPDRSAFAGSVATADLLVRNMVKLADVPVVNAVKMASATPAKLINAFDKKGSIAVGKDADLLIFDGNINVEHVFLSGKMVI